MGDEAMDHQLLHGNLRAVRFARRFADMRYRHGSGVRVEQVGLGTTTCGAWKQTAF